MKEKKGAEEKTRFTIAARGIGWLASFLVLDMGTARVLGDRFVGERSVCLRFFPCLLFVFPSAPLMHLGFVFLERNTPISQWVMPPLLHYPYR